MEPNYRRCLSCRRIAHKSELWRIVRVYPTGAIALDQGIGRSAYLCPDASCLKSAQRKDRLGRALKTPVPEAIYQELWQRLAKGGENLVEMKGSPKADHESEQA
ncbi:MAG: YlxR family protein [Leptolyngbyaceae cyanobacterium HOT.MB2.61]|jgi:predicted RNA-binding protein YlxR (DUF448 family)|nr:YlxR family protein [Leptolyngbyaceae cyanobacterium HOT.MB2.61]